MEINWFTEGEQEELVPELEEDSETKYLSENDVPELEQEELVPGIDLYQEPQYIVEEKESDPYILEQATLDNWSNLYQTLND